MWFVIIKRNLNNWIWKTKVPQNFLNGVVAHTLFLICLDERLYLRMTSFRQSSRMRVEAWCEAKENSFPLFHFSDPQKKIGLMSFHKVELIYHNHFENEIKFKIYFWIFLFILICLSNASKMCQHSKKSVHGNFF